AGCGAFLVEPTSGTGARGSSLIGAMDLGTVEVLRARARGQAGSAIPVGLVPEGLHRPGLAQD
ncbi:MAG: hypothetical protein ACK58T_45705, partial [Phycisphaerae bacterium]